MLVHRAPSTPCATKLHPPRLWIELSADEVATAIRNYAQAAGVQIPDGQVEVRHRDHREIQGVTLMVMEQHQLRLI